jgi:hypothetical protein
MSPDSEVNTKPASCAPWRYSERMTRRSSSTARGSVSNAAERSIIPPAPQYCCQCLALDSATPAKLGRVVVGTVSRPISEAASAQRFGSQPPTASELLLSRSGGRNRWIPYSVACNQKQSVNINQYVTNNGGLCAHVCTGANPTETHSDSVDSSSDGCC